MALQPAVSDGMESPLLDNHDDTSSPAKKTKLPIIKYGELVILGYNGSLPSGDRGRKRSKFELCKRQDANGVKPSKSYVVEQPCSSQGMLDWEEYTISYELTRNKTIIVEYHKDENTDMFQIGRSSDAPIDFVVMDTIPGHKSSDSKVLQSTIPRFACRIIAERKNPCVARIYAAGFNSDCNIFLGEKVTKWQKRCVENGLTKNGVLILHPKGSFLGGEAMPGLWREVSVCGGVFTLREFRSARHKGTVVKDETNVLQDGTLIDLCGATLLWRAAEGLAKSPTKQELEHLVDELNAGRLQCPVRLNTTVIPRNIKMNGQQQPYVYLTCGHVQVHLNWGKVSDTRKCPICSKFGPVVNVCMGIEPAFYVDAGPPTFAFNPCGHIASEKTVKYWSCVPTPRGTSGFEAVCPFCATPIEGSPGYVKLIFQDNVD